MLLLDVNEGEAQAIGAILIQWAQHKNPPAVPAETRIIAQDIVRLTGVTPELAVALGQLTLRTTYRMGV